MASRAERKATLDAMSDDEFYGFVRGSNISRVFSGGILRNPGFTSQQNRDANTDRLLDAADGEHGDTIDRRLGLRTDDELKRQREEEQTDAACRSANSAERSERHAASSKKAAWVAAICTALAIVITLTALFKLVLWGLLRRLYALIQTG